MHTPYQEIKLEIEQVIEDIDRLQEEYAAAELLSYDDSETKDLNAYQKMVGIEIDRLSKQLHSLYRSLLNKGMIGQISGGTLRAQDLVPSFMQFLRMLLGPDDPDYLRLVEDLPEPALENEDHMFWEEESQYFLEDLMTVLNWTAPPFHYFGSHDHDGASFGYFCDMPADEIPLDISKI